MLILLRHEVVQFLPIGYIGNVIFELPSLLVVKEGGVARLDDHAWTEIVTTNIVDPN